MIPRLHSTVFFCLLHLALVAAGCGSGETGREGAEDNAEAKGKAAFEATDDSGRLVSLTERPGRIVSLAPSVTETIFFLGAGEKLVGVTTQCDWPARAREITKVGDFSSPSVERILELSPDLIITTSLEQERWTQKLMALGIPVFTLYPRDCEEMLRGMESLLTLLGETRGGPDSLAVLRVRLREVTQSAPQGNEPATRPAHARLSAFLEISSSPLMTAGRDTFVSDLLERAGGRNSFGILERDYCIVSAERVVEADPFAIFILHDLSSKEEVSRRLGWERIEAVRSGRVYDDVDPDLLLRPGPRAVQGIAALSERLHGKS